MIGLMGKPQYLVESWIRKLGFHPAHRDVTNPYAMHFRLMHFVEKLGIGTKR